VLLQTQTTTLSQPMSDVFCDEHLMSRYRDGDAAAFDMLYQRHKGGVFRYLLRQCGNPATAEELAQEIWLNLIRARERYTDSAKFSTYLYRVAHNRLIDHYRKHQRQLADCFADNDSMDIENIADLSRYEPEHSMNQDTQQAMILNAIANLPAPQREAFLLKEESDLSLQDIADVTGVGVETAKSRLRYAVASLRKALRGAL
jgi:RNA polymerase sigma-70 factor (ECF subfamily)